MKARLLLAATLLLAAGTARAQRLSMLVKTEQSLAVQAPWGYDIIHMNCVPQPGAASRTVTYSDDPDPHSSSPLIRQLACPYYDVDVCDIVTGQCYAKDGYRDYVFNLSFWSLWDVRNYDVSCSGYMVARGKKYWDTTYQEMRECCTLACCMVVEHCVEAISGTMPLTVYNIPATASPNVPSSATCPGSVSVSGSGSDPDGGAVRPRWTATAPNGTTSQASGVWGTTFSVNRSGTWQIRLSVDDNEGERTSVTRSVTTTVATPSISIQGSRTVEVMTVPIELTVSSPSTGCGTLTTVWDILATPPGASVQPTNGYHTGPGIAIPTTSDADIGTWRFRATSTISGKSATAEATVEVTNFPPKIALQGPHENAVGATPAVVRTTITDDRDGGPLAFDWELVQAPAAAGVAPGPGFSLGSSVSIPAFANAAGTWIVRLTATDDDGAPNSSVTSERFVVLVDAPPVAHIQGPELVRGFSQLVLDGSGSLDPDSPCASDPMRCHVTSGGAVTDVSPGLVRWAWFAEPPFELWPEFLPGRVEDVLGVDGSGPQLSVENLRAGQWVFRLEVTDAEGNSAETQQTVVALEPTVPPFVVVTQPRRYVADAAGVLSEAVVVSAAASWDLDNVAAGEPFAPGVGIRSWAWQMSPPAGCAAPPIASGDATVVLFPAGAVVPPACQGTWVLGVTVGDDDDPPQSASGATQVIIGNCQGSVCIDAPKTAAPRVVDNWNLTDVTVVYHLDSALYDDPAFQYGMFTQLEVFEEASGRVVHVAYDPNVLASGPGSLLTFNWNGWDDLGMPVAPGFYGVRVSLLDATGTATPFTSVEPSSIWIEVAQIAASAAGGEYVDRDALQGGASIALEYAVAGAVSVDTVCWNVAASSTTVASGCQPGALSGTIVWDARPGGALVAAGFYTVRVEAYRGAQLLAGTIRFPLVVYRLALVASGVPGAAGDEQAVLVNVDDDDANGQADLDQPGADPDLLGADVVLEPALEGSFALSWSAQPAALRVWDSASRGAAIALPATRSAPAAVPASVFLEGAAADRGELQARLTLPDGRTLGPARLRLRAVAVQLRGDENDDRVVGETETLSAARIGRWDDGFNIVMVPDPTGGSQPVSFVKNDPDPANFASVDWSRFTLRVHDPGADANPSAAEQLGAGGELTLATSAGGAVLDAATPVVATETAGASGVFVSRAQVLTTHDANQPRSVPGDDYTSEDDAFPAHEGAGGAGVVADEGLGDRTHMASLHGSVSVRYHAPGAAAPVSMDVPVCPRSGSKQRAVLWLQPIVFDILDEGTGSRRWVVDAAYVQAEVSRAAIAWQQACIDVRARPIRWELAPLDDNQDPILDDRLFSDADEQLTRTRYATEAQQDVLYVFFVEPFPNDALGRTRTPRTDFDYVFAYIRSGLSHDERALAHEIGHGLENLNRDPAPTDPSQVRPHQFYPTAYIVGSSDRHVNELRRIDAETDANARIRRTTRTGVGNLLLQPF